MNYIHRRVNYDEIHPWWMGRAYRNFTSNTAEFYVFPLNWIVGWSRQLWFTCLSGPREKLMHTYWKAATARVETNKQSAYDKGYQDGVRSVHAALVEMAKR